MSTPQALVLTALLLAGAASAQSAKVSPSAATTQALARYDGVWSGKGSTVMLTAHAGHLVLQGRDAGSTWTAHCVLRGPGIDCTGHGASKKGEGFGFFSRMRLEGSELSDDWRVSHYDDIEGTGTDTLRRLVSP